MDDDTVKECFRRVVNLAKKYSARERDDLIGAGMLAVCLAWKRWDGQRSFIGYASKCAGYEMRRHWVEREVFHVKRETARRLRVRGEVWRTARVELRDVPGAEPSRDSELVDHLLHGIGRMRGSNRLVLCLFLKKGWRSVQRRFGVSRSRAFQLIAAARRELRGLID
jgi:DNA-directed RNA polymerase specialized sigma subunit